MKKNLFEETQEILEKYGVRTKKFLGQNFLINEEVFDKIVNYLDINKNDLVIEIGSGIGLLTKVLAAKAKKVIGIELDSSLVDISRDVLKFFSNIEILNKDVLKIDFNELIKENKSIKISANIPYYITTPIVMHILEQKLPSSTKIALLMQKEVGLRLTAKNGTKDYGITSIVVQYYAKPELVSLVSNRSFFPAPKVDSAIIGFNILVKPPVKVDNEDIFFKTVRASFSHRRKMLSNSLLKKGLDLNKEKLLSIFNLSGIDPKCRAEDLTMQDFAALAKNLGQYFK